MLPMQCVDMINVTCYQDLKRSFTRILRTMRINISEFLQDKKLWRIYKYFSNKDKDNVKFINMDTIKDTQLNISL